MTSQASTPASSGASSPGGRFALPGTELTVARLGYGAMQLAGPHVFGPPKDEAQAIAVLRQAVEAGVDHIDTSDFYGPHITNQLIRKALHPYPKELVLVTKIGARRDADAAWLPATAPDELEAAVHDNLRNLGVEALDIVNFRAFDPVEGVETPMEEPLEVMVRLQEQGLIRHIGVSNVSAAQVRAAQKITPIACVQNLYNLSHRKDEALIDELAAQGIGYVPFFPLGGFTPLQSSLLDEVAHGLGATSMQVALAWLLQRSPNILLIPGTSSLGHLKENMAAATLKLPPEALQTLDGIAGSAA